MRSHNNQYADLSILSTTLNWHENRAVNIKKLQKQAPKGSVGCFEIRTMLMKPMQKKGLPQKRIISEFLRTPNTTNGPPWAIHLRTMLWLRGWCLGPYYVSVPKEPVQSSPPDLPFTTLIMTVTAAPQKNLVRSSMRISNNSPVAQGSGFLKPRGRVPKTSTYLHIHKQKRQRWETAPGQKK